MIFCFDFDDVLLEGKFIDELKKNFENKHKEFAVVLDWLKGTRNTKILCKALDIVVRRSKGMEYDKIKEVLLRMKPVKGLEETFRKLNPKVIMSINDESLIKAFMEKHNLSVNHIYGSKLDVEDGKLTGKIEIDIAKTNKLAALNDVKKRYKVKEKDIVYIGDGYTDLAVMEHVGKAILFCPDKITIDNISKSKKLFEKTINGELHIIEKRDLREILPFCVSR